MMGTVFVVLLLGGIVVAVVTSINREKQDQIEGDQERVLAVIPGFNPALRFRGQGLSGLAMDLVSERLAILNGPDIKIIHFEQIISAEILKDGGSITKTNRGSQMAGAAVGAALLGPAGLLIGGLSGSSRTVDKIGKIALKIYTNDLINPVHEVAFFQSPFPISPHEAKDVLREADEWYGRLQTIIHMAARQGVPV